MMIAAGELSSFSKATVDLSSSIEILKPETHVHKSKQSTTRWIQFHVKITFHSFAIYSTIQKKRKWDNLSVHQNSTESEIPEKKRRKKSQETKTEVRPHVSTRGGKEVSDKLGNTDR